MNDYECGYKQGGEDAHRCEQRHAQIEQLDAENARLRGLLAAIQCNGEQMGGIQHLNTGERGSANSTAWHARG